MTKSSIDRANTIVNAAKIAGASTGSSTRRSASSGGAPRSIAASSRSGPTLKMRPRSTTTTYGIDHVTWPDDLADVPGSGNG